METSQEIKNRIVVSKVIYHNPTNNWGVFTYANDNHIKELTDEEVKVAGNFESICEESEIEFTGTITSHPTYGKQIALTSFKVISNSTSKNGIIDFLTKSSISGIAYYNAVKIYNTFKSDSIDVVLNHTYRIKEIKGIGDTTYMKVLNSVKKYKEQEELLNFCNELGGIPYNIVNSLFESFGTDAVRLLKKDPYTLLRKSNLTFKQLDNIALKMGIPCDNDSRLFNGLLYVLRNESVLKGSTGCDFQELNKSFNKELGIVDPSLYAYTITKLEQAGLIVVEYNQVFLFDFYDAEKDISKYLYMCRTTEVNRTYDEDIINYEINNFPFKLNNQQTNAIYSCLKNKFNIITGAAGTGKSSITKALVNILDSSNENIVLLSPTGKAAKRLNECTNYPTQTIHRFLKIKDDSMETEPISVHVRTTIIIDEASMMDILLFRKLIGSTLDDTRIILVGDINQLPSVQAGNILEDIINSKLFNVCILTDIMRQAENSNIIKYCDKVNKGEIIHPVSSKDFLYLNFKERDSLLDKLVSMYKKAVDKFGLQETQVICAYKLGSLGMNNLNKILKDAVNPTKTNTNFSFNKGDKVRHCKNNYKKSVFNGETGIVKYVQLAEDVNTDVLEDTLSVDYGDRDVIYTKKDIHELQLSYASTVHSSQGSEYQTVFVILDNEISNILLIRKIIYTALSRAKNKCILLSTNNCVNTAIQNNFYKKRITKLYDFLIGDLNDNDFD